MGILKWINDKLASGASPTKPAASAFSAEARTEAIARDDEYEMQIAIEKERNRRATGG